MKKRYQGMSSACLIDNQCVYLKNQGTQQLKLLDNPKSLSYQTMNLESAQVAGNYLNEVQLIKSYVLLTEQKIDARSKKCRQESLFNLDSQSHLAYFQPNVIADEKTDYANAITFDLDSFAGLIYMNGLVSTKLKICPKFKLQTRIFVNNNLILNDIIGTNGHDCEDLGLFTNFTNYNSLFVISDKVDDEYLHHLNAVLGQLMVEGCYDITKLAVPGFVIRLLTNDSASIAVVVKRVLNTVKNELFGFEN